jgi:hypothetical protein
MKKITLLVASIFLFGSIVANAADRDHKKSPVDFRNAVPIVFTERGIQFFLFADGQFDFNTRPSTSQVYYKSGRRSVPNDNYGSNGNSQKWNNGVEIEHDRSGKVRRIGNVFLNYDSRNRIKRIGTVYMDYNRFGLTQVGGLRIVYNQHRQIVDIFGTVNETRGNHFSNKESDHIDRKDWDDHNGNNQDDNYYKTRDAKPNKVVASLDIRIKR